MRRIMLTAGLLCAASGISTFAVPAYPGPVGLDQPDGTQIIVKLQGDELANRVFSEDGHLLMRDDNGYYCYAMLKGDQIVPSTMRAHSMTERNAAENSFLLRSDRNGIVKKANAIDQARRMQRLSRIGNSSSTVTTTRAAGESNWDEFDHSKLLFQADYPTKGEVPALVILVEYQDVKMKTPKAKSYFQRALTEDGFSDYGGTGSAHEYFFTNSSGQFSPQFDVYGPITLKNGQRYYGGNDASGSDKAPHEMVIEACEQLDDEVDFTRYDANGDGYIDNVFVFYAGYGENEGGGEDCVWPHAWNIEKDAKIHKSFDGVKLDRYACTNEFARHLMKPDGIGTFVHEYSHVLGLPDLYETTYSTGACTPGAWSVLDVGPYNNNSRTPPNYSAFERYAMGWLLPGRMGLNETIELEPISNNVAYKVNTSRPNEFFLIEKREQIGNDKYLPGNGMLVWYIDYDATAWRNNTVNNVAARQRVDLIEADGRNEAGTSSDASSFPGILGKTEFTATSSPAFVCRLGQPVGVEFTNLVHGDSDDWETIGNTDGSEPLMLTVASTIEPNKPGDEPKTPESGVDSITSIESDWQLNGLELTASSDVRVYTISGILVGKGSFTLPSAGLYIIGGKKVIVK